MPQAWDNPDAFVGRVTLSAYEPYPILTGSVYTSQAPNSPAYLRWVQPQPLAIKNLIVQHSLSAGVPAATSAASTGSEAYSYALSAFLYSRQDYGANSTNIAPMYSASFGLSASLGYSSTSQQFGLSWVTNSTGGASNFTTTSADAGWSNFASGPRVLSVPFNTTLTAGEYWLALNHSSTAATSNSNVTLLSFSQFAAFAQQGLQVAGALGASNTNNTVSGAAQNFGVGGAAPTFSTTAAAPVVGVARPIWFAFSNA